MTMRRDLVGRSSAILGVNALIDRIADSELSVCIWGEPGSGKRLVSRLIHERSSRRHGPFLVLDCAALPEDLTAELLFGSPASARAGGAVRPDALLAQARMGTLVLEELPALGPRLQVRLLEALGTREPGAAGPRRRGRLVVTTSADPVRAVDEGALVENLYYRVAVVLIRMPALRERPEDIPLLVEHFLRTFCDTYRKSIRAVSPGVLERMQRLPWPGNVRQLEDLLGQAFVLAKGHVIVERDVAMTAMVRNREAGLAALREVS